MNLWHVLLLVGFACAIDQELVDEFMDRVQEIGTKCAEETKATSDDIAELLARKLPPSTHEGKCMIFCVQKGLNFMKADGSVDKPGAMATIKPIQKSDPQLYQTILKIFVSCGMKVKIKSDPCETATDLAACVQQEAKTNGLDEAALGL